MSSPLADRIRPQSLEDCVGQQHLFSEGKILHRLLTSGNIPNMIFYGPSGTGKTTVANIAARLSGKKLYKLNATNASVADIKAITTDLGSMGNTEGVLLYLDEIQNFNKKQQQSLLEFIENGSVTLIASTTENPYFYIYNAILSRCTVFEFMPVDGTDIENAIKRAITLLEQEIGAAICIEPQALSHLSVSSAGDVRKALNALELCVHGAVLSKEGFVITLALAEQCTQKKAFRHDKDGDSHYDVISAFQKSLRGSDPDAAIHYLARLLTGGDLLIACRRLLVTAAEDVGLAYPQAIPIVKACVDSALQLGLPEARIPLAEATILLATAPKSNSAIMAIDAAMGDVATTDTGDVPMHLRDAHYGGAQKMGRGLTYQYPHNYPDHYVPQQYLPDKIKDTVYYQSGDNKHEQAFTQYWQQIKQKKEDTP
ncbi:MAG: replication-associated recombination protein A [Ruminococcaceae bacterium]|nr:replication-associated recombination protein A [Oscillospiraceae bacterium]